MFEPFNVQPEIVFFNATMCVASRQVYVSMCAALQAVEISQKQLDIDKWVIVEVNRKQV